MRRARASQFGQQVPFLSVPLNFLGAVAAALGLRTFADEARTRFGRVSRAARARCFVLSAAKVESLTDAIRSAWNMSEASRSRGFGGFEFIWAGTRSKTKNDSLGQCESENKRQSLSSLHVKVEKKVELSSKAKALQQSQVGGFTKIESILGVPYFRKPPKLRQGETSHAC